MGLLTEGTPLSWEEIVPHIDYIKRHGITQFINFYHRVKNHEDVELPWGDEIEYTLVRFDDEHKKVRVSLRADELLGVLNAEEAKNKKAGVPSRSLWRPELTAYMIEATPGVPYKGISSFFEEVEKNMAERRAEISRLLLPDEAILSFSFPSLGTPDFTHPPTRPAPDDPQSVGKSIFFADEAVSQHNARFNSLTRNIRLRRGEKVAVNIPIFCDVNTPDPFIEDLPNEESRQAAKPNHIYMDHLGLGMGMCCLQITFQAANVVEARQLFDQLMPITPIVLALSAATPIFRSYLADVDSRWPAISASVDDRTREERGLEPLKNSKFVIDKSRCDSADCYISTTSTAYNDVEIVYDEAIFSQLLDGGIDEPLAKHIAHLFIRDPLQIYEERLEQDDAKSTEHFETIHSSNWLNLRFKPPPADEPQIGWRVEFRPTEVQPTSFENAAFGCFVVFMARMIVAKKLTFLVPISKVHENMKRAVVRDAVLEAKFHFRPILSTWTQNCRVESPAETCEMSANEIINGNGKEFPGLVPLILQFVEEDVGIDDRTKCKIREYLQLIRKRASGEVPTLAKRMRNFVQHHPTYEKNSYVNDTIVYDLLKTIVGVSDGVRLCSELFGRSGSENGHVTQNDG